MKTDPKSVVVRYIEAARDGMSAVIRDSFAPDATWEYPGDLPLSGTYRGVDAIVDTFLGGAAELMAPGTQVAIELVNAIADGDQVAAEWTSRATGRNGDPVSQPQRRRLHRPRRQDRLGTRVHRHTARGASAVHRLTSTGRDGLQFPAERSTV